MIAAEQPNIFTIPPHRAFADALAAGLIAMHGGPDRIGLAKGIVLVPSNRAARAITDAFVRRAQGGLLLPRLVPIGDEDLEARIGGTLEPLQETEPVPPAIASVERLMLLSRLVEQNMPGPPDAAEALRLALDLARTLDQLLVEEIDPRRLREIDAGLPDLSMHWQKSLDRLELILDLWPKLLQSMGRIDLAERRNRLLNAATLRWRDRPPADFVVAAGIDTTAPAVARLLRTIAFCERGMVVMSALDLDLAEREWEALGPLSADPLGMRRRSIETHPQFHLKLLLDRMGVARAEVRPWRWGGRRDAPAVRSRAISHAMTPAAFTEKWRALAPVERRLSGVRAVELGDPAEEAQVIAVAIREALEQPGKTVALVTPDRGLARRVAAHLKRWGVEADDSAGRPLSETAPGSLLISLAAAAAERFAPVPLLSLLKHPLVRKGEARAAWLEGARVLDLALRGPRPSAGLAGIAARLGEAGGRDRRLREQALDWWDGAGPLLEPLEIAFSDPRASLSLRLNAIRESASALTGNAVWAGTAGRSAADLFATIEAAADHGPQRFEPASLAEFLDQLMRDTAVRPPYGQHPRVFIWGLLEARLQHADLMILGGLNEGTWPALPTPDPWLAPRIRRELGLPGLERRIGLAAHDFATALGAREVLITRARREARAPAVASRFWLRLEAMTGGLTRSPRQLSWARMIDRPHHQRPAGRPAPRPPVADRPRSISVTDIDRLKADPFAFYARKMLGLSALDPVDADPTAAWRGSAVHAVFEAWMKEDGCDPDRLRPRAEALLAASDAHPLMRALWQPRLIEAIEWTAKEVARNRVVGRRPLKAELRGTCRIEGIELHGIVDRIDRFADGSLAIVDYKTGRAPSTRAVHEGFAMQLGLLGLIAEHGGFEDVSGRVEAFEYWSLAKDKGSLGYVASPVGARTGVEASDFTGLAARNFIAAARRWLTGEEPFTAKLHPEYAPYADYDQLMRLDEWYGRGTGSAQASDE